jgi:predicted transcriptional regulator
MDLLKETAIETIKRMPDGCTIEDTMYKLDFIAQVFAGVKDAESGKLMTTEELLNKVAQWAN